jgi:hypothetical protein
MSHRLSYTGARLVSSLDRSRIDLNRDGNVHIALAPIGIEEGHLLM